jgi:prepilin-type N-terminal cleavage/methylation domain-containing protein
MRIADFIFYSAFYLEIYPSIHMNHLTLHPLDSKRRGFTLVEIMIVVAIIGLLAVVAIPSYLRSRKRTQATSTLETLRMIDSAKDQYAIDYSKTGFGSAQATTPAPADLLPYVKVGSNIYDQLSANHVTDVLGTDIIINVIDQVPQISITTFNALSDVAPMSFWSPYTTY